MNPNNRMSVRGSLAGRTEASNSIAARKRRTTVLQGGALDALQQALENDNEDPFAMLGEENKEESKNVIMEEDDEDPFKLDSPPPERASITRQARPQQNQANTRASNRRVSRAVVNVDENLFGDDDDMKGGLLSEIKEETTQFDDLLEQLNEPIKEEHEIIEEKKVVVKEVDNRTTNRVGGLQVDFDSLNFDDEEPQQIQNQQEVPASSQKDVISFEEEDKSSPEKRQQPIESNQNKQDSQNPDPVFILPQQIDTESTQQMDMLIESTHEGEVNPNRITARDQQIIFKEQEYDNATIDESPQVEYQQKSGLPVEETQVQQIEQETKIQTMIEPPSEVQHESQPDNMTEKAVVEQEISKLIEPEQLPEKVEEQQEISIPKQIEEPLLQEQQQEAQTVFNEEELPQVKHEEPEITQLNESTPKPQQDEKIDQDKVEPIEDKIKPDVDIENTEEIKFDDILDMPERSHAITDDPFQDSDEDESKQSKSKIFSFTKQRKAAYSRREAKTEVLMPKEEIMESETVQQEQDPIEEEQEEDYDPFSMINEEKQAVQNRRNASHNKGFSDHAGSVSRSQTAIPKGKMNNRVGKIFLEDDALFGNIDELIDEHDPAIDVQFVEQEENPDQGVPAIRDTFVSNFDELINISNSRQQTINQEQPSLADSIINEDLYEQSNEFGVDQNRRGFESQHNKIRKQASDTPKSKTLKRERSNRIGTMENSSNNEEVGSDNHTSNKGDKNVMQNNSRDKGNTSSSDNDEVKPLSFITKNRSGIDYAQLIKSQGHRESRLTLRELNMNLPEENSSLDSDEDKEHYLDWLLDEDQRIRGHTQIMGDQDVFQLFSGNPYIDENKLQPGDRPQSISEDKQVSKKITKKQQKQRDLIDVIEELENEDEEEGSSKNSGSGEENSENEEIDEDQLISQEYYTKMYDDVMFNNRQGAKVKDLTDEIAQIEETEELTKPEVKKGTDYKDLMKTIDWNERRYQEDAKNMIKKNSILSAAQQKSNNQGRAGQVRTRIVSNFSSLNAITNKLVKERQLTSARSTCLGLSNDLILIGNSEGQVQMFDRDNEQHFATFSDKSKEFVGNAVTAIDVHPLKPQYVVLGFEKGQIVLFDTISAPGKSLKVVKDHHKHIAIINIKFCNWHARGGKYFDIAKNLNPRETVRREETDDGNQQSWMIASIDCEGYVMITTIIKIVFVFKITKHMAVDPMTSYFHQFYTMACRFQSPIHGQGIYDHIPMVAIGSRDAVLIFEAKQAGHSELLKINKPEKYFNRDNQTYDPFRPLNSAPIVSWGYGMSPLLKDRPHSMLAVAWGPVIQLAVLIDHEENDKPFILDGYYIVRIFDKESASLMSTLSPFEEIENEKADEGLKLSQEVKQDHIDTTDFLPFTMPQTCYIEGLNFMSDSTIMILLSGQDIRILDTQGFYPEQYDAERIIERSLAKKQKKHDSNNSNNEIFYPEELETNIQVAQLLKSEDLGFKQNFPLYIQTLRYFQGKLVVMTVQGLKSCQHLTWQQSIYDFQKAEHIRMTTQRLTLQMEFGPDGEKKQSEIEEEEDLTQVFLRALEIFKGRVKGYQGLIDNSYLRENFLRAELKLLVKEIIQSVIEDLSKSSQNDDFLRKMTKIIRIAIEFCVELKDCDFLFKDLCWLFQDYGGQKIERLFVTELEPFILAGIFQEWELPSEVIDGYIARYYLDQKTTQATPETFEKVIVNLNLNQCSKSTILQFVKYCEQHFLTTGVIFLYTQLFERKDNASCVQVLFSLYDLYKRATDEQKRRASIFDLQRLRETVNKPNTEEQQRKIEKSQVYLGYKLFWVIRLYLNGKKFPQGNIKANKWRAYVHDIVQFLSSAEILRDLLKIDAEALFQVISIIFLRSSFPYEIVLLGRDDDLVDDRQRYQTHIDFLKEMNACILNDDPEISDEAQQQYLFFIANLVSKDKDLVMPGSFYFKVTRQLLRYHKQYLDFNKDLQEMASNKKKADPLSIMRRVNQLQDSRFTLSRESSALIAASQEEAAKLAAEEMKYVGKTENDFLHLLRKAEPLDNTQIQDLLFLAESTSFEQVQLYLLEKKEQYIKCLQMLLREADKKRLATIALEQPTTHTTSMPRFTYRQDAHKLPIATQLLIMSEIGAHADKKGDRTIKWLSEKIGLLAARCEAQPEYLTQYKELKHETILNIKKLFQMSRVETVKLIEERFEGSHKEVLNGDALRKDHQEQLNYLETLLEENDEMISEAIRQYGIGGQSSSSAQQAKNYIDFIKQRLRLCCQIRPQRVFSIVESMVKGRKGNNYFPIEDCLAICLENGQLEAAFLLNKKLGKYYEAVNQGLTIMRTKIDLKRMKIELYFAKKNNISTAFCISNPQMNECHFFDAIFRRIYKILVNHGREVETEKEEKIWYLAIDAILDLKQHETLILKAYCRRFFQQRMNLLVEAMSRTIPFAKFLEHALGKYQDTQFKEFQEIILQIVFNQTSEENVLLNANAAISKVNNVIFEEFQQSTKFGVLFRQKICNICKKYLDKDNLEEQDQGDQIHDDIHLDDEDFSDPMTDDLAKVFACRHAFHLSCLKRSYKKKLSAQEFSDLFSTTSSNKLRCPTCNIANFDFEDRKPQKQGRQQKVTEFANDELKEYQMREQKKAQLRMTRRETQQQNEQIKKLEGMKKRMDYFQSAQVQDGLNLGDFKQVAAPVKQPATQGGPQNEPKKIVTGPEIYKAKEEKKTNPMERLLPQKSGKR